MTGETFAGVVAANWKHTTGFLVVGREPCIRIGEDEIRHVQRRLKLIHLEDVARLQPEDSWFMAVIVCRGDDLSELSKWAGSTDATRVHFYLHADADATQLAPWRDAGFPLSRIDHGFTSWRDLHKALGWDLNVQVYDDHTRS
jgi:hypothetical protein